jgi:hypothetical protein
MELVKILSKIIKENINNKQMLLEYPEPTIKRLVVKFSGDTDDTEEQIRQTISDFERFKGSFENQDRDIFRHSYDKVKELVNSKLLKQQSKKNLENLAQDFIVKYKGKIQIDLALIRLAIKKYLELKELFPKQKVFEKEVIDYTPSELFRLVNNLFTKFDANNENEITKKLTEKFVKENPDEDPITSISPRVKRYVMHYDLIPLNAKLASLMTFEEFEHVVDGYTPMEESEYSLPEIDLTDVDISYEDDDVLIFAPDEKQKCINIRMKLAPDRRWCTSWEGSSNYYYNYRLTQNLTLYYVINKNLPENDLNYAVVILVDKYGEMRLADGSNSGRYSGGQVLPWDEILGKVPVLKNKKEYFEAKPLSEEEMVKMNLYKNYNLKTNDVITELGNEEEAELWLELRSPNLSQMPNGSEIFGNLPESLQKKYIGLGSELSGGMVRNLKEGAMSYYISKKKEKLLLKTLSQLTDSDVETIRLKEMRPYYKQLFINFTDEVKSILKNDSKGKGNDGVYVNFPNDNTAKYVSLFGIEEFFNILPKDIGFLSFENKSDGKINFDVPESLGDFTELTTLVFNGCIKSLPESIGNCRFLSFVVLDNNPNLKKLPNSMDTLYCLQHLSISGNNIEEMPPLIGKYTVWDDLLDDYSIQFPDEMTDKCGQ